MCKSSFYVSASAAGPLSSALAGILVAFVLHYPAHAEIPDDKTLAAAGIRKLSSEHLTLYTDLPSAPHVDQLPKVFEQAIPLWAKFFEVSPSTFDGWHVRACIIQNKHRFQEYKLLPEDIPPFLHGFQMFDRVWVYEQPSPYYRQHLLLHEGTHSAMNRIFGRVGPGWYREGVAEMLGTHRFADGKLTLPYFPTDREVVEYWGRIKIVKEDIAKGNLRSIPSIVNTQTREFLNVESYAWCWALQSFGHAHPQFNNIFFRLQEEMFFSEDGVTRQFMKAYEKQKHDIDTAWNLFLSQLDYGYDSSSEVIHHSVLQRAIEPSRIVTAAIDSTKGWQSTGIKLPANAKIDIAADGRFRVKQESAGGKKTVPWICEPQGVTIEYYQGRPLGQLIAAIVDPGDQSDSSGFTRIQAVGHRARIDTKTGGVLYCGPMRGLTGLVTTLGKSRLR